MKLGRMQEGFGWTSYHTHSEIYAWLDSLLVQYPTILTDLTVGSTFEGRHIRAIRLSRKTVIRSQQSTGNFGVTKMKKLTTTTLG